MLPAQASSLLQCVADAMAWGRIPNKCSTFYAVNFVHTSIVCEAHGVHPIWNGGLPPDRIAMSFWMYSVSFDFGRLRFRAWRLHSAGKAATDGRRSPKSAGSCARPPGLTQARRLCGNLIREHHAPRCSAALSVRPAGECGAEHEMYSGLAGQRRGLSSVYAICDRMGVLRRPDCSPPSPPRSLASSLVGSHSAAHTQ